MSIAGAYRSAVSHGQRIERRTYRIERRSRKRVTRASVVWLAGVFGWCALFLALGWLVAAGFYGLLASA
jgi:hypothetical protein